MAETQMGFEGLIYYGPAGSQANQLIENSVDITESFGTETGSTKTRGPGTAPRVDTKRVTGLTYSLKVGMKEKKSDTILAALKAAKVTGAPVAIRTKDHTTGLGVDGDMIVTACEKGKPLNGEQTVDFTFEPNDDNRDFLMNV